MEKHQVLTVLVADDEPELLGAVCQLIDWESLGFRLVGRAGNGLDALQLVEALRPDFLLTDAVYFRDGAHQTGEGRPAAAASGVLKRLRRF